MTRINFKISKKLTNIINLTINITTYMSRKFASLLQQRVTYFYSEGKHGQSYYRRALPEHLVTLDSPNGMKHLTKES